MKNKLTSYAGQIFGRNINIAKDKSADTNNVNIQLKQLRLLVAILLIATIIAGSAALFIKERTVARDQQIVEEPVLTIELADKNLDPEKHWRNYFEEKQGLLAKDIQKRLAELSEAQAATLNKASAHIEQELADTKEKLSMAQRELASASLDLKRAAEEGKSQIHAPRYHDVELTTQDFDQNIEYDQPKSAQHYIPEGTYFTGHLLGGIAVSTGLNTPDEHATPVAIKLIGRFDASNIETTNLSPLNKLQLQNCRIMGSSYGDLSSERAIVRLEKMVCEQDGLYITSKIAGQIFGSDGLNGVKGTVISTSSKHIKNAAIGGLISGISSSVKGQDGSIMSAAGLVQTKKKGAGSLLGEGALAGSSNAGDKIADYYLRQAEAMSPILTVPSGIRINAQITKGFFVGEISTHKKIKKARSENNANSVQAMQNSSHLRAVDIKSEYMQ